MLHDNFSALTASRFDAARQLSRYNCKLDDAQGREVVKRRRREETEWKRNTDNGKPEARTAATLVLAR